VIFLGSQVVDAVVGGWPGADLGRGVPVGLGIVVIGIIIDRRIGAWTKRRK
jgi:ABC-type proline/glycine betaine transport system permease subunit